MKQRGKNFDPETLLLKYRNDIVCQDMAYTVAWIEDTFTPAYILLKIRLDLEKLHNDLYFEDKENSKQVRELIKETVTNLVYLDKISGQNNTFQIIARHSQIALANAEMKIKTLEDALLASRKDWEDLPE